MKNVGATIIGLSGTIGFIEAIEKNFTPLSELARANIITCHDAMEILQDTMKKENHNGYKEGFAKGYETAMKEQPGIVRCKDCKHATMTADGKMCKYCEMDTDDFGDQRDVYHDADWFCADGERE